MILEKISVIYQTSGPYLEMLPKVLKTEVLAVKTEGKTMPTMISNCLPIFLMFSARSVI